MTIPSPLALLVLLAGAPAQAPSIEGTVVTTAGEPVAGASLWLSARSPVPDEPVVVLAEAASEAGGRFQLEVPAGHFRFPGRGTVELFAWRAGTSIAARSFTGEELPVGAPLTIALAPTAERAFPVRGADGEPCAGVEVAPLAVRAAGGRAAHLPPTLTQRLAAVTDADGRARPSGWRAEDVVALAVRPADGPRQVLEHVAGEAGWLAEGARLGATGPLRVTVEGDGPALPLELRVASTRLVAGLAVAGRVEARWTVEAGDALPTLAGYGGAGHVAVRSDDPAALRLATRWDGAEQGVGRARLVWTAGTPVRGRVVEAGTGRPLAGVRLRASTGVASAWITAGEDGSFALRAAPGGVLSLDSASAPGGFVPRAYLPGLARVPVPAEAPALELPPVELRRDVPLEGVVVDAQGAAAPGAWVSARLVIVIAGREVLQGAHAVSDEEGRFVLHGVDVGGPSVELVARRGDARTGAPTVVALPARALPRLVLDR